jgi:hypothetical protein
MMKKTLIALAAMSVTAHKPTEHVDDACIAFTEEDRQAALQAPILKDDITPTKTAGVLSFIQKARMVDNMLQAQHRHELAKQFSQLQYGANIAMAQADVDAKKDWP